MIFLASQNIGFEANSISFIATNVLRNSPNDSSIGKHQVPFVYIVDHHQPPSTATISLHKFQPKIIRQIEPQQASPARASRSLQQQRRQRMTMISKESEEEVDVGADLEHRRAGDRHRRRPTLPTDQPDPPAPLRVSFLLTRHDEAAGGSPLLRPPERGGIEYIISENLFLTLPDEEKRFWHSHEYEVKSGTLFMPGVPGAIERVDMEKVCKTYGKVFHFWQVDRGDILPLGIPQLMMALTRDGQLDPSLSLKVETRYGVSFEEERRKRESMSGPEHGVHPMANGGGGGLKTELRETEMAAAAAAAAAAASIPRVFV
ncbi:Oil body-associated protein 1A, partial [Cucurbita argyrosperma subsp. sororia]